MDGLEGEFEGQVPVVRLNAEGAEMAQLMIEYGVRGHPSFVVLNGCAASLRLLHQTNNLR